MINRHGLRADFKSGGRGTFLGGRGDRGKGGTDGLLNYNDDSLFSSVYLLAALILITVAVKRK